MATSKQYISFVLEQLAPFGAASARQMFGEYMAYLDGKPLLTVCDNTVYIKRLPELADVMSAAPLGAPYPGARESYIVDIDDAELLSVLIPRLYELTPEPRPRKKRRK